MKYKLRWAQGKEILSRGPKEQKKPLDLGVQRL